MRMMDVSMIRVLRSQSADEEEFVFLKRAFQFPETFVEKSIKMEDIGEKWSLLEFQRRQERALVIMALEACGDNRTLAAAKLGIARETLYAKMKTHGLLIKAAAATATA